MVKDHAKVVELDSTECQENISAMSAHPDAQLAQATQRTVLWLAHHAILTTSFQQDYAHNVHPVAIPAAIHQAAFSVLEVTDYFRMGSAFCVQLIVIHALVLRLAPLAI